MDDDRVVAAIGHTLRGGVDSGLRARSILRDRGRRIDHLMERDADVAGPPYVYVASSWKNPDLEAAVAAVRGAGFSAYDFKNPHHPKTGGGFAWSAVDPAWKAWDPATYRRLMRDPIATAAFDLDMKALRAASATILLTPCGRSAHLEAGWAAGREQLVIAVARPGFEVELMWGAFDAIVLSVEEAVEILQIAFSMTAVALPEGTEDRVIAPPRQHIEKHAPALAQWLAEVAARGARHLLLRSEPPRDAFGHGDMPQPWCRYPVTATGDRSAQATCLYEAAAAYRIDEAAAFAGRPPRRGTLVVVAHKTRIERVPGAVPGIVSGFNLETGQRVRKPPSWEDWDAAEIARELAPWEKKS